MGRIASSTKAQLRRQFLPEEAAVDFAKADSLGSLAQIVAHNAIDFDADVVALDAKVDARTTEARAAEIADASSAAAVSALPPIPTESDVQGWIGDYLGLNLADLVEAEIDIALPVLDPALSPLVVVVGPLITDTATITFGNRGQVTGVA